MLLDQDEAGAELLEAMLQPPVVAAGAVGKDGQIVGRGCVKNLILGGPNKLSTLISVS